MYWKFDTKSRGQLGEAIGSGKNPLSGTKASKQLNRWLDTLSETEVGELGDLLGRRFPRTLARLTGKAISEMGGAYAGAIGAAGRKVEEFSLDSARGYEKMGEAVGSLGRSDAPSTEEIRQRIQELEERGAGGEQPTFREGQPASVPPPGDMNQPEYVRTNEEIIAEYQSGAIRGGTPWSEEERQRILKETVPGYDPRQEPPPPTAAEIAESVRSQNRAEDDAEIQNFEETHIRPWNKTRYREMPGEMRGAMMGEGGIRRWEDMRGEMMGEG